MKKRTRYLSLVLALVLCLNLFPIGWALEPETGSELPAGREETISVIATAETEDGEPTAEETEPSEPEPTATSEPEPTESPEPRPTATPEPEPTATLEPEPTETPEPEPRPTETPEPVPTQVPAQDFVIQDGVLTRYTGPGGDVVIPDKVAALGERLFSGRADITGVAIPEGVTRIPLCAFQGCSGLKKILFPESLDTIGQAAFADCTALEELTFPKNVTGLGFYAFSDCTGLKRVTMENGDISIDTYAFRGCDNISQVTVPRIIPRDFRWAFPDTATFSEHFVVRNGTLIGYCGPGGDVVIPDVVTSIDGNYGGESGKYSPFAGNKDLTGVTLPAGVTSIEQATFQNCANLKSVTALGELKTIDNYAFSGCKSLQSILSSGSLTYLGNYSFSDCVGLTAMPYSDRLTYLGTCCFSNCTGLTSVHIPASVTSTGGRVFSGCTGLTEAAVDNPDLDMQFFFSGCTNLKSYLQNGKTVKLDKTGTAVESLEEKAEKSRQEAIQRSQGSLVYAERLAANQEFLEHITERDYIYTIVTEDVQALSDKLCEGLTTDREKVYALHEWVTENIYYDYPSLAGVHPAVTAQYVLDRKTYVCSGYTVLMQALCWAQKIPCVYIQGPTTNGFHAWNAVEIDGEWLWLDATWDTFNKYYGGDCWVEGDTRLDYFLCSDEFISTDHKASYTTHSHWQDGVLVSQYVTWCYTANGINADLPDQTAEETREIIQQGNKDLENEKPLEEQLQQKALEDPTLSDWAEKEVSEAISKSLVPSDLQSGYTSAITRLDFCRLMVTLVEQVSGKNINTYLSDNGLTVTKPFTDTTNDQVLAAYALGIVKGTSETTFNSSGSITRQEAATMLARTAKLLGLTAGASETFRDITQIADWAKDGVFFVSALKDPTTGNKVMGGTGDGNFSPLGTYTREQAILTALRLFHCE